MTLDIGVFYHHAVCAAAEQHIPIEEELHRLRELGIRYLELDRDDIGETDAQIEMFRTMLDRAGLGVSSIYGFYEWQNRPAPDFAKGTPEAVHLRQARGLGSRKIMLIPGFYSGKVQGVAGGKGLCALLGQNAQRGRMIRAMREMTAEAAACGLTVTIEDFDDANSPIAAMDGMERFLKAIPDLRVTLDTGNLYFSGEDVLKAQERFRGRIAHVHLKDRWVKEAGGDPPSGERKDTIHGIPMYPCAVGAGIIPMQEVLRRLRADGYEGIVTIEHFGVPSYAEAIRKSAEWLRGQGIG